MVVGLYPLFYYNIGKVEERRREKMEQFVDQNGCHVRLTFANPFTLTKAKHVWAVCRYREKWVLTKHRERGLEFPGGKVEEGEEIQAAVKREVYEETGAVIDSLHFIGQYEVACTQKTLWKNIYYAKISSLEKTNDYFETDGPVLVNQFPSHIESDSRFSFIMKDELLPRVLAEVKRRGFI